MEETQFDNIRPYNDNELRAAMKRLSEFKYLEKIDALLFPDKGPGYLASLLPDIKGVDDFQTRVMSDVVNRIIFKTTDGLTVNGLENLLDENGQIRRCVMLSTHRDIILDPAFVQIALYNSKLPCTLIATGDNLIINSYVEDMIRSNRMIKVIRSESPREVYLSSMLLSLYIRSQVAPNNNSVWIAHRQGRTKDGHDATEQGLLKMLNMSGDDDFVKDFGELRLQPVAISYEYETCCALKAMELFKKERDGFYKKSEGEDLNSMIQGVLQPKGRVHIEFSKPITIDELRECDVLDRNEKFRHLASIVDTRLMSSFKLWPSNYAAADIVEGSNRFSANYTEEDKARLLAHIDAESKTMPEYIKERMLKMYAAHLI